MVYDYKEFEELYKFKNIDLVNYDIQSNLALINYQDYLNSIIKLNPLKHKSDEFKVMDLKDIVTSVGKFLVLLFGNDIFDIYKDFIKQENINLIGNSSESILLLINKFIEYICNSNNISYNNKFYYREIIPLYIDKIISNLMENVIKEDKYINKIDENMLNNICYQIKLFNSIKSLDSSNEVFQNNKYLLNYFENMRDLYGIGYLYSEALYHEYLNDQKSSLLRIKNVLNKRDTLQSLLNYYGIQAKKDHIYGYVDEKIRNIKRFK